MAAAPPTTPYPFAAAPDIIRSHQKDAYFTGSLSNTLTSLHRSLLGARSAHAWAPESRLASSLLYLSLTTLVGNRTLGEEYTDVIQLHASNSSLPSLPRRATYILASVLAPYLAGKLLPRFRARLRAALEARAKKLAERGSGSGREARTWRYVLENLSVITSSTPLHALSLAVFYFSGTYYEVAKRILGLRYIFTRKVPDTPDRVGYEVLGALLAVQLATQTYLHIRSVLAPAAEPRQEARSVSADAYAAEVDVSLSDNAYASNNELLVSSTLPAPGQTQVGGGALDIETATHTPVLAGPRYDLADDSVMGYIRGGQQRKCTLCLEALRDPAATQCGHVFCWGCIGDWVREKPECPLCRREAMVQHILPLRVV
ncbi:related to C3HC4 zinc-binding integral peroxisomal membrane protein [Cephalotrichum gorgonifer]|uniref:RING-type E3 ubiquitin transferase n=1 Tax=Cephalotrichum gorgonifer TaxID=2041049 RepID=A0AAE8MUL0_9PEZI|nr:related to C3HC4 zinc-binding integral peroxisomal membrane protein [Cephalotrichum gorgonifer]